ncbi:unnamed protein product [Clonostachys chloroleuca]|uniref:Uncharacterized protein n=1 Tax=Clonostachys chloroleuca TaxID=1926264 RepID=A0AA35QF20_9HYPO|nr:unnamed protein product [Clonostachys chloroleuca]
MASPSNSHSRLAALPSKSVLPPPRDPVFLGEPTDQPPKSDKIPPATARVRPYSPAIDILCPPTTVNDGKPSSPSDTFPIRESHLLANQHRAAWRNGLPITLTYDLEIHSSLANAENNIKNEWLEQGVGETIGVVEHPDKEGPELAEQADASVKHSWNEKNLGDKKPYSEPGMKWAHEKPEEEEGEQAAAQMEGQAEHLPGDSRPHCSDDETPRIDRPSEGNNAHAGASRDSFEAEEQPRTTIQSFAGPSRAPNQQGHFHGTNFNNQLQLPEESPSKEGAPDNL